MIIYGTQIIYKTQKLQNRRALCKSLSFWSLMPIYYHSKKKKDFHERLCVYSYTHLSTHTRLIKIRKRESKR